MAHSKKKIQHLMKILKFLHQEESLALMAVILFMLLVVAIQGALLIYITNQGKLSIKEILSEDSLYNSNAGIQYAKYIIEKEEFNPNDYPKTYNGIPDESEYNEVNITIYYEGYVTGSLYGEPYAVETYRSVSNTELTKPSGIEAKRKIEAEFKKYWKLVESSPNSGNWWVKYDSTRGTRITNWEEMTD